VSQLGQNRFLPNPFQFNIDLPSYRIVSLMRRLITNRKSDLITAFDGFAMHIPSATPPAIVTDFVS
jgi:hypothetical protein